MSHVRTDFRFLAKRPQKQVQVRNQCRPVYRRHAGATGYFHGRGADDESGYGRFAFSRENGVAANYIQISLRPDVSAEIGIHRPGKGKDTFESVPDRDALINSLQVIHAENPDLPVLIAADKNIIYNEVVQVISDAKKMGISRVGLATR